jgi:hypothetical protein
VPGFSPSGLKIKMGNPILRNFPRDDTESNAIINLFIILNILMKMWYIKCLKIVNKEIFGDFSDNLFILMIDC